MFTSFTGNTRRPRQINLGGKTTTAFGIDRAQQERAQRQRERDNLNAARLLQRVWRGHASRTVVADELRSEWDAVESTGSYRSTKEALSQLLKLLRFASPRTHDDDLRRLQHYVTRQRETVTRSTFTATNEQWPPAYLRLERLLLAALERETMLKIPSWTRIAALLDFVHFVAEQIPAETSSHAQSYYRILSPILSINKPTDDTEASNAWRSLLGAITVSLKQLTGYTLNAYEAFGIHVLTHPLLSVDAAPQHLQRFRDVLADSINYKLLANALATLLKQTSFHRHQVLKAAESRLRLLSTFIYFHRYAHNFHSPEAYAGHRDFVAVVSLLLNSLPLSIIPFMQTVEAGSQDQTIHSDTIVASEFIEEQLLSLVHQEGIANLLTGASQAPEANDAEKTEEARHLANYALALLRSFPNRGDEIRMWLYMGPSRTSITANTPRLPAIRYFWEASKRSAVFATIFRDSRAAVGLLRSTNNTVSISDRLGSSELTRHDFWNSRGSEEEAKAAVSDEWRVVLVFLELYTFLLKVADDEEFFSARQKADHYSQIRENGLSLNEVKDLTTFLKNLGFTLYFNAAEIILTEDNVLESSNGSSFFNPNLVDKEVVKEPVEPSIGGIAGLTLDHVKGLVTGLLRMIYERDSRRPFLPADHWLMTSRFDMTGFIPAVVEEEESRHRVQEEDADDVDLDEDEFDDTPQLIGTGHAQQQRRLERLQRQQRKASRRRYLQAVAPRLEVLQNTPFFIPFTTRVQIFREFVHLDMTKRRGNIDPEAWRFNTMQRPDANRQFERHTARISRENEFEDAFDQFYSLGQGLKEPIQITFVDQFGAPEAGIDGGGVTKEFLTSVTNRAFMPTDPVDMFIENEQHLLYPNPSAVDEHKALLRQVGLRENSVDFRSQISDVLQRFEFLGRIIGKCLYEGILVDVNFAPFFLRKWALTGGDGSAPNESGYRPTLNDLRDLDEELYQGLHKLKTYLGDVEDFSLNFTVTDTVSVYQDNGIRKSLTITKDLKPDGANTAVTNQNRLVYISYIARHRLQQQPWYQTQAFLRGLSTMIQPSWLSMFNQSELQTLVSGTRTSIDIDDLRRNTVYGGTYVIGDDGLDHPTIALFWKIMKDFSDDERRAVLKFVTSTPRAPLLGFGTLNPRFSIRDAGSDQERLPSTSTCVNLLKLPMYRHEGLLKEKLLYSVFSGAGFDLS